MRYGLRTLLIVLALGPPVLAAGWLSYLQFKSRQGSSFEWGGVITVPADDAVPIEWDELEGKIRETLAP